MGGASAAIRGGRVESIEAESRAGPAAAGGGALACCRDRARARQPLCARARQPDAIRAIGFRFVAPRWRRAQCRAGSRGLTWAPQQLHLPQRLKQRAAPAAPAKAAATDSALATMAATSTERIGAPAAHASMLWCVTTSRGSSDSRL